MAIHIVMFAAARDALLPSKQWKIAMIPLSTTFLCPTPLLWLLAAFSAVISYWIIQYEPAMAAWQDPAAGRPFSPLVRTRFEWSSLCASGFACMSA